MIGSSRDTGYFVFEEYFQKRSQYSYDYETFQPVFIPEKEVFKPRGVTNIQKRIPSLMLPDKYSYIPKKKNYYTRKGFKDFGLIDISKYGWDEFVWQNRPYGVHMRNSIKKEKHMLKNQEIKNILKKIIMRDFTIDNKDVLFGN